MTVKSGNQVPVNIHLKTKIEQGGESERYELLLSGHYYEKGNSVYLKYDEILEEGTVHTIVKMGEEDALILRSGALKMRLAFHIHTKKNGSYESPHGTFLLAAKTKTLNHSQTGINEGKFLLKYSLLMNEASVGSYEMEIQYKEALTVQ